MKLEDSIVYAQGRFLKYDEARVGLLTHGLNYGEGCFEGIRGYWSADDSELNLIFVREHYERLHQSAKILFMTIPHSVDELVDLTVEVCARNRYEQDVYIRPLLYKSAEDVGVRLEGVEDAFAIATLPFTRYFDASAGLKVGVSSWRRIDDSMAPVRAKISGAYINSALAKSEALLNGFDEAIMLSSDGHVSEASASNLFVVKNNYLHTPDASQNVLEGITRRAIIMLAQDHFGLDVLQRPLDRSELYTADEIFLSGTAAGVSFIRSVDHRQVGDGKMGPVTSGIRDLYERAVRGQDPKYKSWITPTYAGRRVTA
jgi:branched-chain amino acid aminotransferase